MFRPRRYASDVAQELVEGLGNGTIVLQDEYPESVRRAQARVEKSRSDVARAGLTVEEVKAERVGYAASVIVGIAGFRLIYWLTSRYRAENESSKTVALQGLSPKPNKDGRKAAAIAFAMAIVFSVILIWVRPSTVAALSTSVIVLALGVFAVAIRQHALTVHKSDR